MADIATMGPSCIVCGSRTDLDEWTWTDPDGGTATIVECTGCLEEADAQRRRGSLRLVAPEDKAEEDRCART
jgi:hypothetical protein